MIYKKINKMQKDYLFFIYLRKALGRNEYSNFAKIRGM
ncbi:hypothetical protein ECP03047772_2023 [Escherichia coli P0304777.2]|nr:hypothetical protein ECP03047772_2023 [Escherichia coli P0304777.2]ENF12357.1 hypothetical protein ECP03047779_2238 [Escherichia coli P0304777.9]